MVLGDQRTPHGVSPPAHASAVAFLRGGLLAIVALLAPPRLTAIIEAIGLGGSGGVVRLVLPALGFVAAGALGGKSLGVGARGVRAFALGGLATGVVMAGVWPQFSGLTGHEPLLPLLLFATLSWGAAFGLGGGLAGFLVDRRSALPLAAWFAGGGVLGAIVFIAPSLLVPLGFRDMPSLARLAVSTLTSIVGLLVPFAVGGAAAGRAAEHVA